VKKFRYLYFDEEFIPKGKREIIHHPELPKKRIHSITEEASSEKEGTIDVNVILQIDREEISPDIFKDLMHEGVKNTILQFILSSKKEIESIGKESRILKQQLIIKKIHNVKVDYLYLSKQYSLWLYDENTELSAEESPISEIYESYFATGCDLYEKKEYSQALEVMNKVIDMGTKMQTQKNLQEARDLKHKITKELSRPFKKKSEDTAKSDRIITKEVSRSYYIGGVSGGIISEFIFVSILNPSGGFVKMLIIGTFFGIIIGSIVGWIFQKKWSSEIKESRKRFLYPFWTSVLATIFLRFAFYFLR